MHPVQAVWPAVSTISIYNTIKDPQWYVVQGIRRGGNDDAHSCFFARTKTSEPLIKLVKWLTMI